MGAGEGTAHQGLGARAGAGEALQVPVVLPFVLVVPEPPVAVAEVLHQLSPRAVAVAVLHAAAAAAVLPLRVLRTPRGRLR